MRILLPYLRRISCSNCFSFFRILVRIDFSNLGVSYFLFCVLWFRNMNSEIWSSYGGWRIADGGDFIFS